MVFENILEEDTDDFFNWIRLKSEKFRFNKDLENIDLPDTYIPELGKCFKNSQYYHFFIEYDYFEGFASAIGAENKFIYHAFNVKDGLLSDFTFYSNMEEARRWLVSLPDFYLGIKIPSIVMIDIFDRLEITLDELRTSNSLAISLLIAYFIIDCGLDWDIHSFVSPIELSV